MVGFWRTTGMARYSFRSDLDQGYVNRAQIGVGVLVRCVVGWTGRRAGSLG